MTSILKKYLPTIMAVAAVISFVGAILVLAIPVARTDVPYKQVLGIIIAVFGFKHNACRCCCEARLAWYPEFAGIEAFYMCDCFHGLWLRGSLVV